MKLLLTIFQRMLMSINLLPGNTGIKIPMFLSYQNTTINPNYDPANPDMRLDAALKSFNTDEETGQLCQTDTRSGNTKES